MGAVQTPSPNDASAPLVFSLRYWPPDAALHGLVTGYHHYMLDPGPGRRHHDVFYPAWANLRIQTAGTPWSMTIGDRQYDRLPEAAMFGPTSHASYCSSAVGALIGVGFSPLGYSRLTRLPADAIVNQVVPLDMVLASAAPLRPALLAARRR